MSNCLFIIFIFLLFLISRTRRRKNEKLFIVLNSLIFELKHEFQETQIFLTEGDLNEFPEKYYCQRKQLKLRYIEKKKIVKMFMLK